MPAKHYVAARWVAVGLSLLFLAIPSGATVSASGTSYDQVKIAAVYSYVPYFGRAFSHTRLEDLDCGTYAFFLSSDITLNTNFDDIPNNWVATIKNVKLQLWVFTGSTRVTYFFATSPLETWYDQRYQFSTYYPGEYPLSYPGIHFMAIPESPSTGYGYGQVTYSGPLISAQAARRDYLYPYREYSPDPFSDIPNASVESYPTSRLYSLGITTGTAPGYYDPGSPVPRYQMASFIARAMGWQYEEWWDNNFSDIGWLPYEHQRHIRALAHYGVARGYEPATCAAFGRAHPCFVPEDNISYIQTLAFISRAHVAKGYWGWFPDQPSIYPGAPAAHRQDITTYAKYSGAAPDTSAFSNWYWNSWATNRGWYARALWQALP